MSIDATGMAAWFEQNRRLGEPRAIPAREETEPASIPDPADVAATERPIDRDRLLEDLCKASESAMEAMEAASGLLRVDGHSAACSQVNLAYASLRRALEAANCVRLPRVHRIKADPGPFRLIWAGLKPFEVRKFDRDYRVGDMLRISEFDRDSREYSGAWVMARITCIVRPKEYGLPEDVGVLGIEVVDQNSGE